VVWRGIAARRLLSLTIFVLTALMVSGTLVSIAFSRLTGVSRGAAGALVLLGFVALATQSVESIRRREPEIALAKLRGRKGGRLLVFAVAEPCVVVVCGAFAGVVGGWLVTGLVVDAWLPSGTTAHLGRPEWTWIGLVTLGSLLLVVAASWSVVRAPLLGQLTAARRPHAATTFALFLQLLVVIGAVVSVYQAHQAVRSRVDWVTLVSPALVGLAGGQVMVWLVLAVLAIVVPHTRGAQVGWFLTVRRLLRRADSLGVIRVVVAAGVVFGVAASASIAAQNWRDDRARLEVGGPVSYPVPAGALRAYAAAVSADPQRRWLLPVVGYTASTDASDRRVFVDFDRWRPVVGDFFAGTPSGEVATVLAAARPTPPVRVDVGTEMSATVVASSLAGAKNLTLGFQYVDDHGDSAEASLALRRGGGAAAGRGLSRFSGQVPRCHLACSVIEVDLSGRTSERGGPRTPLRLVDATFAGQSVLDPASGAHPVPAQQGLHVVREDTTLEVTTAPLFGDVWVLGSFRSRDAQPAVSAGDITSDIERGQSVVEGIDGVPRAVSVVAQVPALPLVGTSGRLLDLASALAGSGGSIPDTEAVVIARADTPARVITALRSTHTVGRPTTYDQVRERLGQTPRAQGTRLYVLVAGFAALIALVAIASALTQQIQERRREAASLRSVGVRPKAVAGAYRREALVLAGTTFVGTTLAAWTACRALLPALPLVSGWEFAPALDATPRVSFITVSALVSGLVVGAVTFLAFRRVSRAAAPRILREDAS
jgi:hypothetical protein